MKKIDVNVVKETTNELPKYETAVAAGCDIRAELSNVDQNFFFDTEINEVEQGKTKSIKIKAGGRCLVPTGLKVAIPDGYELQVRTRSGLAIKKGLIVLNCPGCVDPDFRGIVQVLLINHSNNDIIIEQGERIAQFILQEVKQINWKEVDNLEKTNRGEGGMGSTGTK